MTNDSRNGDEKKKFVMNQNNVGKRKKKVEIRSMSRKTLLKIFISKRSQDDDSSRCIFIDTTLLKSHLFGWARVRRAVLQEI